MIHHVAGKDDFVYRGVAQIVLNGVERAPIFPAGLLPKVNIR
jgi:hypothetical protein